MQFLPLESIPSPVSTPRDSDASYSDDDVSVGHFDGIVAVTKPVLEAVAEPTKTTSPLRKMPRMTHDQQVTLFTHVMTFLPFDDLEVARKANAVLAEAADRVAPKPLDDDRIAFIRWEPQDVRTAVVASTKVPASSLPTRAYNNSMRQSATVVMPAIFPWRCLACGHVTSGPRQCGVCRSALATSACRVFLGQLRKDLSAELCMAMVRWLTPDVTVLHMESHTNIDGRGKGCAWAYVDSVEDALRIVELHKRVFVDLDTEGGEGFWYIQDPALIPALADMADILGAARNRPLWLPRQPLVAELPAKSMLADYVNQMQ